jgi:hypothetical protein
MEREEIKLSSFGSPARGFRQCRRPELSDRPVLALAPPDRPEGFATDNLDREFAHGGGPDETWRIEASERELMLQLILGLIAFSNQTALFPAARSA